MSRSVDIDFDFRSLPDLQGIILLFHSRGAELIVDGVIDVTTDGDFTWEQRQGKDLEEAVKEMERTLSRNECVGFKVTWPAPEKRGRVLLMPQSGTFSFAPDVDTLKYGSDPSSVGLGWYLDELGEMLKPMEPTTMKSSNSL